MTASEVLCIAAISALQSRAGKCHDCRRRPVLNGPGSSAQVLHGGSDSAASLQSTKIVPVISSSSQPLADTKAPRDSMKAVRTPGQTSPRQGSFRRQTPRDATSHQPQLPSAVGEPAAQMPTGFTRELRVCTVSRLIIQALE